MTAEEYIQLKAFARIDGALLSVMWIASFALYVIGMTKPMMMIGGIIIAVSSPVFTASRVRKFRGIARYGIISFGRAYIYSILTFFYASLLFAIAQFVYFQFIDGGYIISQITEMMSQEPNRQVIQAYGMTDTINESLSIMTKDPSDRLCRQLSHAEHHARNGTWPADSCADKKGREAMTFRILQKQNHKYDSLHKPSLKPSIHN